MYQQTAQPVYGSQPPHPHQAGLPPEWQWAPVVMGGGAVDAAQAAVPQMRARDGVAGLAIGLCALAVALAAGIGFTVRETGPARSAATPPSGETATPAAPAGQQPLAADGHAHQH